MDRICQSSRSAGETAPTTVFVLDVQEYLGSSSFHLRVEGICIGDGQIRTLPFGTAEVIWLAAVLTRRAKETLSRCDCAAVEARVGERGFAVSEPRHSLPLLDTVPSESA